MPANDLKERLERAAGGLHVPDPPVAQLVQRGRRMVRRRRAGATVSAALLVAAMAWTIQGLAGLGSVKHPATSPTPSIAPPPVNSVIHATRVGYEPLVMSTSNGTLWVTNSAEGTISRIDSRSGALVATLHVPIDKDNFNTTGIGNVTLRSSLGATPVRSLGGQTWVAAQQGTFYLDLRTNRLRPGDVPVGGIREVSSIASGGGVTWVCCGPRPPAGSGVSLERVNEATMLAIASIPVKANEKAASYTGSDLPILAVDREGALWVGTGQYVDRYAPGSNELTNSIKLGPGPRTVNGMTHVGAISSSMVFEDGTLWVCCDEQGRLLRIDPKTRRVVGAPLPVPESQDLGRSPLAAGGGFVWTVQCCAGPLFTTDVFRLDPRSLRWTGPARFEGESPGGITIYGGSLWVLESRRGEDAPGRGLVYRVALVDFERAVRLTNSTSASGIGIAWATTLAILILLALALVLWSRAGMPGVRESGESGN